MVFELFKKKDPICGMKQEKGKGFIDGSSGNWFCSPDCQAEFNRKRHEIKKQMKKRKPSCCH